MSDATTDHPRYEPTQEVRLAVVLYGGVSLAIYINGVAQELLALVRATAPAHAPSPDGDMADRVLLADAALSGAEGVYRTLGRLLAHGGPPGPDAETPPPGAPVTTRFVVDIVSGTSAGGINGVYLAKALANDQSMDRLRRLWVEEGDIAKLVNDPLSYRGLRGLPRRWLPQSLLNSARMYWKLLEALDGMGPDPAPGVESPLVDELDLWVTTTDVRGVRVPLDLFDRVVSEQRYRKVFHFVYRNRLAGGGEPDAGRFRRAQNPMLAFAARCTSAFPFAFEPMELADIDAVLAVLPGDEHRPGSRDPVWDRQFLEYAPPGRPGPPDPMRYRHRAFADGGYLDNKPFSWATDTLPRRRADLPVDRRLVYVDPDPGAAGVTPHPGRREADERGADAGGTASAARPDAIANVVAALTGIPRYEPIREDLERILDRNRDAERLADIVAMIDGLLAADAGGGAEAAALERGPEYRAYLQLRLAAVADDLAGVLTELAGFEDDSDEQSALRCLLQAWLDVRDGGGEHAADLLARYDVAYVIRRINFVSRRASAELAAGGPREPLTALKRELGGALVRVRRAGRAGRTDRGVAGAVAALGLASADLVAILDGAASKDESVRRAAKLLAADGREAALTRALAAIADALGPAFADADATIARAVERVPPESSVRRAAARFDLFDSIRYPIGYGNVGEIAPVEVVRISPRDATAILDETAPGERRRKLAGTRLGHFGGFFARDWRCNDLLWGRLDAAERIVATLLPAGPLRTRLVAEAQAAILRDALRDPGTLPRAVEGVRGDPAASGERLAAAPKTGLPPVRTAVVAARMAAVTAGVVGVALGEKALTGRRAGRRR